MNVTIGAVFYLFGGDGDGDAVFLFSAEGLSL